MPRLAKADWIKPCAAVMDVGTTYVYGEPVGDVEHSGCLLPAHGRRVSALAEAAKSL